MARQIVRQPDGKLALFSTITDSFLIVDADTDEIIQFMDNLSHEANVDIVKKKLDSLDSGIKSPWDIEYDRMVTLDKASQ